MAYLAQTDYENLLTAVHRLECCRKIQVFPRAALQAARELVAADRIGFEYIAPPVPAIWGVADPPPAYESRQKQIFCENLEEHPMVAHYYQTGDPTVHKLSDFVTAKEWHRTTLYRELYQELQCENQMACPLTPPDHDFYVLAFYRERDDFTERDRTILSLLRPHVAQILENLLALDRAEYRHRHLEGIHEGMGRFVLWIDNRGWVVEASPAARDRLHAFFPEWPAPAAYLPDAVLGWLAENVRPDSSGFVPHREPYVRNLESGQLTVRYFPVPKETGSAMERPPGLARLLLEVDRVPVLRAELRNLGLSDREVQVFHQLEQGKTNTEIAAHLSISPLTVKKHLENMFNKLGVNSRAGAVGKIHSADYNTIAWS